MTNIMNELSITPCSLAPQDAVYQVEIGTACLRVKGISELQEWDYVSSTKRTIYTTHDLVMTAKKVPQKHTKSAPDQTAFILGSLSFPESWEIWWAGPTVVGALPQCLQLFSLMHPYLVLNNQKWYAFKLPTKALPWNFVIASGNGVKENKNNVRQ
jgi:hypothetical protein